MRRPDHLGVVEESDWEEKDAEASMWGARLARWALHVQDEVRPRPDMPQGCTSRLREKWQPLARVAQAAGPRWLATMLECAAEDVAVVAYASLGVGDLLEDATVRRVAEGVGRTPAQVLLRWGLQQGLCVLPKSGDPARIAANGAVFDFELPADAMRALDGLAGQGGGKRCWDPRGVR